MRHKVNVQTIFMNKSKQHHDVFVDASDGNEAASLARAEFMAGEFHHKHKAHIARTYILGVEPAPLPYVVETFDPIIIDYAARNGQDSSAGVNSEQDNREQKRRVGKTREDGRPDA